MDLKTPTLMRIRKRDLSIGGWSADPNKLYRLWFELLALSPSYELAKRYRLQSGKLSKEDKDRKPADFEAVLKVFDDFGDVQKLFFKEWWTNRGLKLLGSPGNRPETKLLFKASQQWPVSFLHIQSVMRCALFALVIFLSRSLGTTKKCRQDFSLHNQKNFHKRRKPLTEKISGIFTIGGPTWTRTRDQRIPVCAAFTTPWTLPS
jgi:hypothetical protein